MYQMRVILTVDWQLISLLSPLRDHTPHHSGQEAHDRQYRTGAMKDGEEGPMNVFAMALSGMDQTEIGWMMVAVIFSQLVMDEALRRVEASVGTNARACLREVYKELSTVSILQCVCLLVS
jgi:hypothetical protein